MTSLKRKRRRIRQNPWPQALTPVMRVEHRPQVQRVSSQPHALYRTRPIFGPLAIENVIAPTPRRRLIADKPDDLITRREAGVERVMHGFSPRFSNVWSVLPQVSDLRGDLQ